MIDDFDFVDDYRKVNSLCIDDTVDAGTFSYPESHGSLRILHTNIRSFNKNIDSFLVYLDALKIDWDVIVLGETWLGEGDSGVQLGGYRVFKTLKGANRNDGVFVYVSERVNVSAREVELGGVHGLCFDLTYLNKQFNLLTVYRTHDCDLDNFTAALNQHYSKLSSNKSYLLIGDVNANLLATDNKTERYLDVLYEAGFMCGINSPTREVGDSKTIIDHIFIRHNNYNELKTAVFKSNITDHYCVALEINIIRERTLTAQSDTATFINKHLLGKLVRDFNWTCVTDINEVNNSADLFFKILKDLSEESREVYSSNKPRLKRIKPWITENLIRGIRNRDKISKTVKKQPFNTVLRIGFIQLRNRLNAQIKLAKINYYRTKINSYSNNPKMFWQTINELAGRHRSKESFPLQQFTAYSTTTTGDAIVDSKQVAQEFNNYFSHVGYDLARVIDSSGPPVVKDNDFAVDSTFSLHTITENDLRRYITSMRGGSAPGYDCVPASFLINNQQAFIKPLLHIINSSIRAGVFPDVFKVAKVIPLFKSNDVTQKSNFRPISLLSVFSKILERIVKDQLVSYLEGNNILTECQFGFRKTKNISDVFYRISKYLNSAMANGRKCLMIFLDLAKAFDSVDREKLLEKLYLVGIRNKALDWFKSYLDKRQQLTSINGINSELAYVDYGVIQGSSLGPLLFLIYINNLSKVQIYGQLSLFADDTAIFIEGSNWEDVFNIAARDLSLIKKWFDQNLLSLNISKSKFMPIALRDNGDTQIDRLKLHSCGNPLSLTCHCESLERVNEYKYLGVLFDNRLTWTAHINYLNNRLRKLIYAFKQLGEILKLEEIKITYYAYVQSLIEGGIIMWGAAYRTNLNPLFITQKAILKAALSRHRRYSSEALFAEISVMDVRQLFVRVVLTYIFKNSGNMFEYVNHQYPTRNSSFAIKIPKLIKTFSTTNSYYVSHIIFSNIPIHLKDMFSCSLSTYKLRIKAWLHCIGKQNIENIIMSSFRF